MVQKKESIVEQPQDDDNYLDNYFMYEIDGSLHSKESITELAEFYEKLQRDRDLIKSYIDEVRDLLWSKTDGTTKTRRLETDEYEIKVVEGKINPNGSLVSYARKEFPEESKDLIVPASFRVAAAPYKKMLTTTYENPRMQKLKELLQEAYESGYQSAPIVTIKKKEKTGE